MSLAKDLLSSEDKPKTLEVRRTADKGVVPSGAICHLCHHHSDILLQPGIARSPFTDARLAGTGCPMLFSQGQCRATGGKKGGCRFLRRGKTAHFRGHKGMYISAWLTHLSSQKCSLTARCSRPCADTVTRSRHRGCAFNRGNSPLAHCFLQQSLSKRLRVFFQHLWAYSKVSSPGKGHGKVNTLMVRATANLHRG